MVENNRIGFERVSLRVLQITLWQDVLGGKNRLNEGAVEDRAYLEFLELYGFAIVGIPESHVYWRKLWPIVELTVNT